MGIYIPQSDYIILVIFMVNTEWRIVTRRFAEYARCLVRHIYVDTYTLHILFTLEKAHVTNLHELQLTQVIQAVVFLL
jgi:hypothetical protein